MTINDKQLTAAEILALALNQKPNYWGSDGSPTWKSRLGKIRKTKRGEWVAMPNGCEDNPTFAVRKDAMDYVKENAKFSSEPEEAK